MPTPTSEQDAWVASTFGVDPTNYAPAANGGILGVAPSGAPYSAPTTPLYADAGPSSKPSSRPPAVAPAPAPDTTPSCWITVTNDTKSVLKLAHQGHDIGDFESFPASTLQPGGSTSFVSTQTPHAKSGVQGCKGFVEWTIESADGTSAAAATWRVSWNNPVGEKNTAEATISPSIAGFSSLEQIGEGDAHVPVVFTLSAGVGGVAQPAMPDPHNVEITIQNDTDGTLLLVQEFLSSVSTQSLIPATIAAGQTAKLVVEVPYLTSSALVYAVVPTGVAKAPSDAPTWEVQWLVDSANKLVAQPNTPSTPGLTAEAKSDGIDKATFKLSGKLPVAALAQPVGIVITNGTDQILHLVSTNSDGGRFDSAPPGEIAPGAKVALAAVNTGPKGGTLVYRVEPKDGIIDKPDQLRSWTLSWTQQAGQQPLADATLEPEIKGWFSAASAGKAGVAYILTGTTPAATTPAATQAPAQRIDISISNKTDRTLVFESANSDAGQFDPAPPREIAAGATVSIAMAGTDLKGASIRYRVDPKPGSAFNRDNFREWTLLWSLSPGQQPQPSASLDEELQGVTSTATNVGNNAVAFALSGMTAAAAPAQPQPPTQPGVPVPDQHTHVTLTNKSNMLLRLKAADHTKAQWDPLPHKDMEIKPGDSFTLTTVTNGETDADLWYEMLPMDGSAAKDADAPMWLARWRATPGELPTAWNDFRPVVPGLVADAWIGKDEVTFQLSGEWSPLPREFKTSVSIANETKFALRLTSSEASAGRFDPVAPKEIAPGAMVFFATWAKEASNQKLAYELVSAESPPSGEAKAKASVWTMTWRTRPGYSPTPNSSFDGPAGIEYGPEGHDGLAFKIYTDDADKK
jgi:hypothetical protein